MTYNLTFLTNQAQMRIELPIARRLNCLPFVTWAFKCALAQRYTRWFHVAYFTGQFKAHHNHILLLLEVLKVQCYVASCSICPEN